jgi:hypothetical protein
MNQMNEMNNEEPDIDIQTAFIGTMGDIISKSSSGSITDTKNVMLYFEGVEGVKYSFKVSVKSFTDREKTVLHERMSFVDIFKAFKDKLVTISFMDTKKSTKVIFEELVIQKLSEGNEYKFVDTNKFHLVEDSFIDWVTESFPELLQYTNPAEGNDYLRFEYDVESESWVVYANQDFTAAKSCKVITKGTKGGTVSDPTLILGNTWIEEGSYVEGHSVLKDVEIRNDSGVDGSILYDTLVDAGSSVMRSFVFNSTLESTDVVNCRLIGCNYLTSYLYGMHGLRNSNDYVHYSCGDDQRFIAVEAKSQCFNPITADNVGTEGGQMIVGVTVTGDVKIIRGCFHGTLAEFKDRIDENFGRTTLDSEQYYAFVKYMHDKVASKRYYAILPLVQESLKVFDCLNGISFRPSYSNHPILSTRIPNYNNGVTNLIRAIDEYDKFKVYYHRNFN